MTRQGDLFRSFGQVYGKQGSLFDTGPRLSSLSCVECGEPMEETPSGWICCPKGHGKLRAESEDKGND